VARGVERALAPRPRVLQGVEQWRVLQQGAEPLVSQGGRRRAYWQVCWQPQAYWQAQAYWRAREEPPLAGLEYRLAGSECRLAEWVVGSGPKRMEPAERP